MPRAEVWDDPDRWRQPVPRPPVIPPQKRRQLAREWVDFLGIDASEEFIERLSAVVMRYHPLSPKGQTANRLVRAGEVPYRKRVEAVHRGRGFEPAEPDWRSPENTGKLLRFIEEVNGRSGAGPTWSDVASHMGWSRQSTRAAIRDLARRGCVMFTARPRSLQLSPNMQGASEGGKAR